MRARAKKEKALELAGERSRAFGFQLAEGTDVNTNSKTAKNQPMVASTGRRSFVRKAGAVALASVAAVAVAPAQADAVIAPSVALIGSEFNPQAKLTKRQTLMLRYFDSMEKSIQLVAIDVMEEWAKSFPAASRQNLIAGGVA